jgi:hypothetical protein
VDLTANEPTAPEIHFTPVPLEDDPDLLPNPNGSNGRNGSRPSTRTPVGLEVGTPSFPVLLSPPPPPARRSPNAVFELVARYQAGRRRADHDPPGADADPS